MLDKLADKFADAIIKALRPELEKMAEEVIGAQIDRVEEVTGKIKGISRLFQ